MAPEVCTKVELLCGQTHESAMVVWLKAQIGYRKGDCGWQLARSEAGIRFLGLMACLTTIDHWVAAVSLRDMILETAADKNLIPSALQLKQLIQVLECRLVKSSFTESVLGFSIWISNSPAFARSDASRDWGTAPSNTAIAELVKAIRGIARIGEEVKLLITAPINQAAWIAAFLKWCLGIPPSIALQDGTTLLPQLDSNVLLTLDKTQENIISISQVKEMEQITDLVQPLTGLGSFRGMVNTRIFMQKLLQDLFGSEEDILHQAALEALPLACAEVTSKLRGESYRLPGGREDFVPLSDEIGDPNNQESRVTWGEILPTEQKIASTITQSVGLKLPDGLTKLQGSRLEDLKLVALAKSSICRSCACLDCKGQTEVRVGRRLVCQLQSYIEKISICVAIILAISLLESRDPDGVLLHYTGPLSSVSRGERREPFVRCIFSILQQQPSDTHVKEQDVLRFVLQLLGHDNQRIRECVDGHDWIMSSEYGQTVYPELLETNQVTKHGSLTLLCVPGVLLRGGQPYVLVRGSKAASYSQSDSEDEELERESRARANAGHHEICRPRDAFGGYRIIWRVTTKDNELAVSLASPDFPSFPGRNPAVVFAAAAQSLFVDCVHDPASVFLPPTDHNYSYTTPVKPTPLFPRSGAVGIVPCYQNEKMRFLTLASGKVGVVRHDACIKCCIDYCHLAGLNFVIS
jgi:hypothetical protein